MGGRAAELWLAERASFRWARQEDYGSRRTLSKSSRPRGPLSTPHYTFAVLHNLDGATPACSVLMIGREDWGLEALGLGSGHIFVFLRAKFSSHVEAIRELTTMVMLSLIPYAIGLFSFVLVRSNANWKWAVFEEYISTIFMRGQLFLIATSFLATALYRLFSLQGSYNRPYSLVIFAFYCLALLVFITEETLLLMSSIMISQDIHLFYSY